MGTKKRYSVLELIIRCCSAIIIVILTKYSVVQCIVIDETVVYGAARSPYLITDEIVIEKEGNLILDPGITLQFEAGVGITVRGIFTAKGTDFRRITLTSVNPPPPQDARPPSLRLIDGSSPTRGRLQMFYKDKWRSICTNSRNWTETDRSVACRELGFTGGFFYEWQDRPNNDTATILYEEPSCIGQETGITRCAWQTHAMGGGVCDMHPDMGLACSEYHSLWRGTNHWKGVSFENAAFTEDLVQDGTLFRKVSRSTLEYVRFEYAGMGPKRELTAAIQSFQVPPTLRDVVVTENAFTGVNFTLPDTFVNISHCVITKNRGIGLYVNSSVGSVYVEDRTIISDNFHDGIKFNLHPKEPDVKNSEQFLDFCSGATNMDLTYPLITVFKQLRYSFQDLYCKRTFYNPDPNMVYTIHFNFAEVDKNDSSVVEVRDINENGPLLTKFPVRNYTIAPSVVSKTSSIYIVVKAEPRRQVVLYMQVYAHRYKIPDIVLNNSMVERNMGHGMSVHNMRSLVLVHRSNLTDNIFGSGLSIRGGAGAVNVTYSTVTNNIGDGINITYEGGIQNVTWSTVSNNLGRGVAVWFNESGLNTKIIHETAFAYTTFESNLGVGVLVGNFCRDSFVNISSNTFKENEEIALHLESCWRENGSVRNVHVGHNLFLRNKRLAILVSPAVNMNLSIEWNFLHENQRGTIKVYNEDLMELEILSLNAIIKENTIINNSGLYAMLLTLSLRALDQHLLATRNILKYNVISEAYPSMTSRSKASAVVCIGSLNVQLYRNLIENPDAFHELSSHALDQTTPINASYNWLGKKSESDVFDRVFDRRDRYNLAVIEFHPFLLSDNNMDTPVTSPPQYTEPSFFNPMDNTLIGGEINGNIPLTKDFYYVTKDIFVQHTGILTIPFGTTLEFAEGVGMMITGTLLTEGSGDKKVRFTLAGTTQKEKLKALIDAGHINEIPDNMTSSNETAENDLTPIDQQNITVLEPDIPVKLVGGHDEMEGRLMVYLDGVWGTVCNHGWTEDSAAIACQQMGYVLNPEDWFLLPGEMPFDGSNSKIIASNVRCDEFDTELLQCKFDPENELENSCNHRNDVGLRCYLRTWAGIRFGMTAKESHVKGVIIEKAGLLDYTKRQFKPALQVDFNQHVLQELIVQDNSQDGIGIIMNNQHAISNPEARVLKRCFLRRNRRHGITFAQLGANITNSIMTDNKGSGMHFNPYISREQQRELTGWLKLRQDDFIAITPQISPKMTIEKDQKIILITKNFRDQPHTRISFTVSTPHLNVIGIQILNPISNISTEQILIYDYPEIRISKEIALWNLHKDLTVFPTTSSSYAITFQYNSGNYGLGDVIIALTGVEKRNVAEDGDLVEFQSKVPVMFLEDSRIARNRIGISTLHYNRYLTDDGDHLLRNSNLTIAVIRTAIVDNSRQAVYCLSPFRAELDNDRIGEVKFMFNHSTLSRNGRGVDQFSWDLRESNNLFHWIFDNVTMEGNGGGGVTLSLPYVWQYNENFTHTVYVNKSRFIDNADFEFTIDGQFARVNITKSKFERNVCSKGVLAVRGMEKEMFIRENTIINNVGVYMVEFNVDSQSEILGNVFAYFEFNKVQFNRQPPQSIRDRHLYPSASVAISVRGLQKVNITYNLLGDNEMDYEFLAGLFTARIDNKLNVRANWWGSREVSIIRERIFDFDDWNNYAVAFFQPFLIEGSFDASVATGLKDSQKSYIEDETTLGGRLTSDLLLKKKKVPYVVKSDLTVMPDVTLRIEPGVVMEFFPSVGILVLGKLEAIGRRDQRILMRPVNVNTTTLYRVGRQVHRKRKIDIRLCIEGECEGRRDGFLDIYNATTQQWVPMCDDRFSERNAQVVCNQLGYNRVNVFYAFDKRTEMFPNALTRIRSWPEPIQCRGMESRLDECPVRMNGQIYDHHYECPWNEDFVYIYCGDLNLQSDNYEYWGGVRFSIPDFEYNNLYDRIHATNMPHAHHHHHTHERIPNPSVLAWVDITGAGILHNEKSPAIFSFYKTPKLLDVSVTNSAYDGASFVSSHETFEMLHCRFEQNLGVGLSLIGLTGETRESTESSFTPVEEVRLPYNLFGMVDICDTTKELLVEERLLLYYKYDNKPIDCVKIFSSVFDVKKFGFRLLQFNLFNSTLDPMIPDRLILYDGDIYNETTKIITEIDASTRQSMRLFKTRGTRLSVQLHATGGSGVHGFVAEIITIPISTIGLDRDLLHNMTYNQFYNNQEGAIFAVTAGEVNPWLAITWNRIEDNGLHLYANITTTEAAIKMDLQNMRYLYFKNNLVKNNTGGLKIMAGSNGAATKLWANITNNLFEGTIHFPSLYIESKKKSAYQKALIANNDFSWAHSPYHDVITLAQIVSDFSYNYVHSNLGRHILDIYGFEKVRLPVYQTTAHNSFAKNRAVDPVYPGTIIAGSAGQQYVDNVFFNLENAYELVAVNESVRCNLSNECDDIPGFQDFRGYKGVRRTDVWKTPIDARGNWWGFNTSVAVSGRIHDKLDDDLLLRVNYQNWKLDNYTLLQGCEPGYHLIGGSCYLYVGAPITFFEAKDFCKRDNATLPFLTRDYNDVRRWIRRQQPEYQWDYDMVWVADYDHLAGCTAFVNYRVRTVSCDLNLPFICESDSDDAIDASVWISDSLVIGSITATIGCFILVIACLSCWGCKSRQRRHERIIRRNSIRASIRSNRSIISSSSAGFSDFGHRRRIIEEPNRTPGVKVIAAATSNGHFRAAALDDSFNSIAKSTLNYSVDEDPSYVVYETTHRQQQRQNNNIDTRFAHDPDLENHNVNMTVQPTFDMAYQNRAFRDNSTFASPEPSVESRELSDQIWPAEDSNPNIVALSTPASFRDRSIGGSTTHVGMPVMQSTCDTTALVHDDPVEDIHMADTLPRDLASSHRFVSADTLTTPAFVDLEEDRSSNLGSPTSISLSQSQPLETAM